MYRDGPNQLMINTTCPDSILTMTIRNQEGEKVKPLKDSKLRKYNHIKR